MQRAEREMTTTRLDAKGPSNHALRPSAACRRTAAAGERDRWADAPTRGVVVTPTPRGRIEAICQGASLGIG